LAGGREYKIVSLSEEKKATELSRFTEVVSVFKNRHTEAVSVPAGKHTSFLAGGRRYKIVSLSMKTRPQNLVVYGSCISVYKSSYRSCISVRWEARGPLLPGSSLAGWREYKIVSLSEEKKATELTVVLQKLHQCL
jgi:hypothetical protein